MLAGRTLKEVILKVPDDQLPLVLVSLAVSVSSLFAREVRMSVVFVFICYEQLIWGTN